MRLRFSKMHGLGNDFVVIDAINQPLQLSAEQARFLADRHRGIGCDQILLVEPPTSSAHDFRYRIFNADGSEVEQCGNGARCFARFVREQGLSERDELRVETAKGVIRLWQLDDQQVRVDMGAPVLNPADIPFQATAEAVDYELDVDGRTLRIGAVSMGNPHAVLDVDDLDQAPVAELGPRIEHHPRFPARVNAGFMQVVDRNHIRLRVFERGAGETQACGSGACAAVVAGRLTGRLDTEVRVSLNGGDLVVSWDGPGQPVFMSGPAASVFDGQIQL